jgi:transketolase
MGEKDFSDRALVGDDSLSFVPPEVFGAVTGGVADPVARAALVADLCRINTLFMIMQAGSGHIGSSFSSTDIITWLWTEALNDPNGASADADVYFSSKGHDAPALYSLLIATGRLGFDLLPKLRQLNGLPGHPDVSTPFIATNTGSLGMGISKAYGMARANRYTGRRGRIVVMTGDGELQEGQIWESLQPVANERLAEITVIVDHNKLQSDSAVSAVSDLGPIEDKFRAFGWEVRRGDGHDFAVLRDTLAHFATVTDRPKVFIADTIKGKGVSFMEGLACGDQTYHFHAGAPSLKDYVAATRELIGRVNAPTSSSWTPICCRTAASRRSRRSSPSGSSSAALRSSTWCRPPAAWRCAACCRSCIRSRASCRRAPTSTSTTTPPRSGASSTRRRSPASCRAGRATRINRSATSRR